MSGFAWGILRIRSAYSPLLLRRPHWQARAVPLTWSGLNLAGHVAFNRSRAALSLGEGFIRTAKLIMKSPVATKQNLLFAVVSKAEGLSLEF